MFSPRVNWFPILLFLILILLGTSLLMIDIRLKSSILEISQSKAQLRAVELINKIVNDRIVEQTEYDDIFCVHKDNEGSVVLLQANTLKLNQLMARTTEEIANSMSRLQNENIEIPVGQITGSRILAAYGPKIKVKIIPAGQVHVKIENKFEEAGINQSRHLIYFNISSKIKVAVPFMDEEVEVASTVPLAETIIVGKVPDTYVKFTGSEETLYPFIKN